jgi:hypothetical protein
VTLADHRRTGEQEQENKRKEKEIRRSGDKEIG